MASQGPEKHLGPHAGSAGLSTATTIALWMLGWSMIHSSIHHQTFSLTIESDQSKCSKGFMVHVDLRNL